MGTLLRKTLNAFLHTWLGYQLVRLFIACTQYRVFSEWTVRQMQLDALRLQARRSCRRRRLVPTESKLHVGCGQKRVPGWLNVDIAGTEILIDLAAGWLP